MVDREPLTIEVLAGSNRSQPAVLDRVIGGTVYLEEAKRIGHHLLTITEGEVPPHGFRVLNRSEQLLYAWRPRMNKRSRPNSTLNELSDMIAVLLATVRRMPSGPERYAALKQIGIFQVRLDTLARHSRQQPR